MKKTMISLLFTLLYLAIYFIAQSLVAIVFAAIYFIQNRSELILSIKSNTDLQKLMNKMMSFIYENISFILLISVVLTLGFYYLILYLRKSPIKSVILMKKTNFIYPITAIVFGISANVLISYVLDLVSKISSLKGVFDNYGNFMNGLFSGNQLLLLLTVGIIVPCFEEILFRGLVFNELKKIISPTFALVLQALIFGIYHFNFVQSSYAFLIGLILGFVYMKTKTILVPMLFHIAMNSSSSIFSFKGISDWMNSHQTLLLILGIILFILCISVFFKAKVDKEDDENLNQQYLL